MTFSDGFATSEIINYDKLLISGSAAAARSLYGETRQLAESGRVPRIQFLREQTGP